jgi:UBX domain-containing protein 1
MRATELLVSVLTISKARTLLDTHDWDVESAVSTWFASREGEGDGEDETMEEEEAQSESAEGGAPVPQQAEAPSGLVMGGGRTLAGGAAPAAASAPTSSASTARRGQPAQRGGPRTLKDLQSDGGHAGHGHGPGPAHDDEDDSADEQDFFAGGEKSGLAVQNPNAGSNPRDRHINSLFERARR